MRASPPCKQLLHVFSDDVDFEVDVVAGLEVREVCDFPGLRNDRDFEVILGERSDG